MPQNYDTRKVKCPFYKEEDELIIKCEGTVSKVCSQQFKTEKRKKTAKRNYCNSYNYRNCPYSKLLSKQYDNQ